MNTSQYEYIQKKHPAGFSLLKQQEYEERLIFEIEFIVSNIDNNLIMSGFSENFQDDMLGIFNSFIKQDLKKVYAAVRSNPALTLDDFTQQEFLNLAILKKCATNFRYQVKSLLRNKEIRALNFKSSFIKEINAQLNSEIQILYKRLSNRYRWYFRQEFAGSNQPANGTSLQCIENFADRFESSFIALVRRFYQLYDAIDFVRDLFSTILENEICNRIAHIFYEKQDRLEIIINYFIDDLKRNFIRAVIRNAKNHHSFDWIQEGLQQFLLSDRFRTLQQKVIIQTLYLIKESGRDEANQFSGMHNFPLNSALSA